MTTGLSRRRFLGITGGAVGAAVGGAAVWTRLVDDQVRGRAGTSPAVGGSGRVLVVIELAGGNDGLNTLVPADGRYRDARPTLAVPEADLVALDGERGHALHPALAPLASVWASGHLAAVQGVGFVGQTRSHFTATDIWRSGGEWPFASSWLGRWLDATAGEQANPLRAIALGADTPVLAADRAVSTVVKAPDSFRLLVTSASGLDAAGVLAAFQATAGPLSNDPLFAAAQTAIPTTLEAVDLLAAARAEEGDALGGSGVDAQYTQVSTLLGTAARIVELDLGTEVFVVGTSGYDTHGQQLDTHARLLTDLGTGVSRFMAEMERQGRADDVLVVTTSEFGRRVAENGSLGTDHGYGSISLLAGPAVQGGIVGDLGLDRLVEGDLPVTVDAGSVYAVALDWLGGPTDDVLGRHHDRLGLV